MAIFKHQLCNAFKFVSGIVWEVEHKLNSRLESRIGREHLEHFVFISRQNNAEFTAIIFHSLYESVNCFLAVVGADICIISKRICLIDKKHAAHSARYNPACLFCSCSKVLTYKSAAIYFDDLVGRKNLIFIKNACDISGNFGFTGTGIAQKAHMDIKVLAVLVVQGIGLNLANAFLDSG